MRTPSFETADRIRQALPGESGDESSRARAAKAQIGRRLVAQSGVDPDY
jgi:hypothetical protein